MFQSYQYYVLATEYDSQLEEETHSLHGVDSRRREKGQDLQQAWAVMQTALTLGPFNSNRSYGILKEPTLRSDGCVSIMTRGEAKH